LRNRILVLIGIVCLALLAWWARSYLSSGSQKHVREILRQAELSITRQQPGEAADQLNWILKHDPTNEKAHYLLGQALYSQKAYSEALEQFLQVTKESRDYEPALMGAIKACLQSGNMEQAEESCKTYLAEYPDSEAVRTELQWLYFNRLQVRKAKQLLRDHLPHARNPYPLLYHLLQMEAKPPIAQESIGLLKRINEAQPGQASVISALGYCYWNLGKINLARDLIEQSLSIDPCRPDSILIAADFYLETGDLPKCESLLQDRAGCPPQLQTALKNDDRWHWILSRLQFQKKQYEAAQSEIQQALETNPHELKYLQHSAMLQQILGHPEAAQSLFKQVKTLGALDRELYKIVSSGVLDHATPEDCLQIADICKKLGRDVESSKWNQLATAMQTMQQQ